MAKSMKIYYLTVLEVQKSKLNLTMETEVSEAMFLSWRFWGIIHFLAFVASRNCPRSSA